MEKIIGRYKIKVLQDADPESPRTSMDNLGTMVCFRRNSTLGDKHNYRFHDYDSWDEMEQAIIRKEKAGVILPLYVFEHGGMAINTTGFQCPWDSGQVGFIFISKQKMLKEYGGKICTKQLKERVKQYLVAEVETYNQYLQGEVYGYEIWKLGKKSGKEKKMIDSCWGFYGQDECMKEAEACVPEQKEITEQV